MATPNLQKYRVESWQERDGNNKYKLNFPLTPDSLVFEVGGYLGDWTQEVVDKFQCRVYVFEPVLEYVTKLEERFQGNELVKIFPFGLADKTEEIEMSLTSDASSVLSADHLNETKVKVKMVRAVDFLQEQNIENVDLVQMNIEGAEYDLLTDLVAAGSISKIENLMVQFHDFVPNSASKRSNLEANLFKTHYPTFQFDFVWENWRRQPDAASDQLLNQIKFDREEILSARDEAARQRATLELSEQQRQEALQELAAVPQTETLVQKIKRKLRI